MDQPMKKVSLACVAGLLLSLTAASAPAAAPSVDSILQKAVAAGGGRAAMDKVRTRAMKFTVQTSGLTLTNGLEILAKAPNKQWSRLNFGGMGEVVDAYDGQVAWGNNSFTGLRVKTGDEAAKARRDSSIHRDLEMKTLYPGLAFKGTQTVSGQETYVLEAKPTASSVERFFYDTKTGLLLRQESVMQTPEGQVKAVVDLSSFKAIDQLQYPHRLTAKVSMPSQETELNLILEEVKHNIHIPDSRFAKPAQ